MKKRNIILIIIAALVVVLAVTGVILYQNGVIFPKKAASGTQTTVTAVKTITYKGHDRVTALVLLQQVNTVVTSGADDSLLVTSINGIKADSTKNQSWAFYVNGAKITASPASYITKDGDTIEWKLITL
jgi:hypothetical protein